MSSSASTCERLSLMRDGSCDPRQRMSGCQKMAVTARMKIHAVLSPAGMEPDDADELVCAVEAGAVANAHC
ncbi:hypothetical protein [Streptomyces sp. NPDC046862]|uniref:hypothetical protein n=1 Tax=Streptomyces sp. NPDC046862 TaxID=3154603 RepID=UPI003452421D